MLWGGLRALRTLSQSPTLQIHQHCLLRTFPMAYSTGQVVLNDLQKTESLYRHKVLKEPHTLINKAISTRISISM